MILKRNNKLINKNKMTILNIKYLILFINSNIFYNSSTLLKSLLVIELI